MTYIEELRKIRERCLNIVEENKQKVESLSKDILKEMKDCGDDFKDIFDEWLEFSPKKDYPWIQHIEVDGKDMWEVAYYEADRYRNYSIEEFVDRLRDCVEDGDISEETMWKYYRALMDKNVGSIIYDW